MTKQEILQIVKTQEKINGNFDLIDNDINEKIEDVIDYIYEKTGIEEAEQLELHGRKIVRGVRDLYNYDAYQTIFLDLVKTMSIYGSNNNA